MTVQFCWLAVLQKERRSIKKVRLSRQQDNNDEEDPLEEMED